MKESKNRKTNSGEKVAEFGSKLPDMIEVEVIQAHRVDLPGGGFIDRAVGDKLTIEAGEFCANIHRMVEE